jgi:hypothetical protein
MMLISGAKEKDRKFGKGKNNSRRVKWRSINGGKIKDGLTAM